MTLDDWRKIPPTDRKRVRRALRKLASKFDRIELSIFDFNQHRFSTPHGDILSQGVYVEYDFTNSVEPNPTAATDAFVDAIDTIESNIRKDFFIDQESDLIGDTVRLDVRDDVKLFMKSLVPNFTGNGVIVGSSADFTGETIVNIGKRVVVDSGYLPDVIFRIEFNDGRFYVVFRSVDPSLLSKLYTVITK